MMGLKNKLYRRSDEMWNQAYEAARHPIETVERRPFATAGVIAAVLGVLAFIWLFPELRRYLRIERM